MATGRGTRGLKRRGVWGSQALDKDNSGTITLEELQEGMREQGSQVATKEMQALLASIDVDASGTIAYDEFLAATIHQCQLEKDDVMLRAFQSFDTDNSGYITIDELEAALKVRDALMDDVVLRGCNGSSPSSSFYPYAGPPRIWRAHLVSVGALVVPKHPGTSRCFTCY